MNQFTVQRACAWSGMVGVVLFFLAFVLADFLPPLSPSLTPEEVAAHYREHSRGIIVGMLLMMFSGMFITLLVGVISAQLRRIPTVSRALVYAQISAGTAGSLFFFIPPVMFIITAFRPDRAIQTTYMLNDLCWILTVLPFPPALMQNVVIGTAILSDKRPQPLFPRWVAYVNFWVAIGFLPASALPFFKYGAFAWNGLFPFWLAATVFFAWFVVMTIALLRAIRQEEEESGTVRVPEGVTSRRAGEEIGSLPATTQ
ncbi:MAG: hypothetical protein ABW034_24030 [Steroidobacteraceae bacterium]